MTIRQTFDWQSLGYRVSGRNVYVPTKGGGEVKFTSDTLTLGYAARQLMEQEGHPMTIRQIYYRLFSTGFIHNSVKDYQQVIRTLVEARQKGVVPWDWVEDRIRVPREVQMWSEMPEFCEAVRNAYYRDVWADQENYCELWLEKNTLSPLFMGELRDYGVTLNVGGGYDGWSSLYNAAQRYIQREAEGKEVFIHYFGDHDPSGDDMVRSLGERLGFFQVYPEIKKWSITEDDVTEHDLPPEPGKLTDSRSAGFVEKYGELIQVELDALPIAVLRQRIRDSVESTMDLQALQDTKAVEAKESSQFSEKLNELIAGLKKGGSKQPKKEKNDWKPSDKGAWE